MTEVTSTSGPLLVQMSGAPGAGKSTIARGIAAVMGAVVIDHDVVKSALIGAGVPAGHGDPIADPEGLLAGDDHERPTAGRVAYAVEHAMAQQVLSAGRNVILDSPCYYELLLGAGQRLASACLATYQYIECVEDDLAVVRARLRERASLPSQCTELNALTTGAHCGGASGDEVFRAWSAGMHRPAEGFLTLDTSQPIEVCVKRALVHLGVAGL